MKPLQLWLVDEARSTEFAGPKQAVTTALSALNDACFREASLAELTSGTDRRSIDRHPPDDRGDGLSADRPDLLVVLQSWPDQFTPADVCFITQYAPLARVIVCYGSWCGADGRTRSVWPLAWRIPVEGFAERLAIELAVIAGDRPPLPATASREELFRWESSHYQPLF
jgi:hypothetical protein